MSKVPTWVRSTDGYMYMDPVLRGPGWFLCFDDDNPPEIVIRMHSRDTASMCLARAMTILDNLGLQWEFVSSEPLVAGRDWGGLHIRRGCAFALLIKSPIPTPQDYDARLPYKALRFSEWQEGTYYTFEKTKEDNHR